MFYQIQISRKDSKKCIGKIATSNSLVPINHDRKYSSSHGISETDSETKVIYRWMVVKCKKNKGRENDKNTYSKNPNHKIIFGFGTIDLHVYDFPL